MADMNEGVVNAWRMFGRRGDRVAAMKEEVVSVSRDGERVADMKEAAVSVWQL